jgi:PadR family transcriptional regulator PadR
MNKTDEFSQLRKGLLEFAVLAIIAERKVYAADMLQALSGSPFATGEGTLYPLLSKLKRDGWLQYEWIESEQGPPRKYYGLTESGAQHLKEMQAYWHRLNSAINTLRRKS